jgi:peptidoglycan/xylan/chitin deacetylase (PgdA/CDA1 family)
MILVLKKILTAGLLPLLVGAGLCAVADAAPAKDAATVADALPHTAAATLKAQAPKTDEPDLVSYPLVLEYHQITPVAHSDIDVSIENFKWELDWLQDHNYKTLTLRKFIRCIDEHKPLPDKSVLITFDDGYQGVYQYALPELRKRYMHATLFLTTSSIGKKDKNYPRITVDQIHKMSRDYLVDLASHTVNHDELSKLSPDQCRYELQHSKAVLEDLTGKPCVALAYPYGDFNQQVLAATQTAGYQVAFAGYSDAIASHLKRYTIPRIYVGEYVEKDNFKVFKQTMD